MNARRIPVISVCAAMLMASVSFGTTITFENGLTTPSQPGGTTVGGYYSALGVTMPNLRFHLGTYAGNVPFNFSDNWGAVIDFGIFGSSVGIVQFATAVQSVRIDALAQGEFNLNGAEPFSWRVAAFDAAGNQLQSVSENFGFDFAGVPNAPNIDPYPLARLSLSMTGIGPIARLEISSDRKLGIDTFHFERLPIQSVPAFDSTYASIVLSIGALVIAKAFIRRKAWHIGG